MMKDLGANAFSYGYASPVLIAVTYNDDGTVNVMNLHEVARTNAGNLACCIGKPKKTHENIEKRTQPSHNFVERAISECN